MFFVLAGLGGAAMQPQTDVGTVEEVAGQRFKPHGQATVAAGNDESEARAAKLIAAQPEPEPQPLLKRRALDRVRHRAAEPTRGDLGDLVRKLGLRRQPSSGQRGYRFQDVL